MGNSGIFCMCDFHALGIRWPSRWRLRLDGRLVDGADLGSVGGICRWRDFGNALLAREPVFQLAVDRANNRPGFFRLEFSPARDHAARSRGFACAVEPGGAGQPDYHPFF